MATQSFIPPRITNVTVLRVCAHRTAEIAHANGHSSVMLREGGEVAAELFAACDAEMQRARDAMRRAALYRKAAWFTLGQRDPVSGADVAQAAKSFMDDCYAEGSR